ncbi:phage tail assembly protein T [Burkholderia aenigmatica]|uniref:phage tail assembly protein T n=1 Tax=Burkholderia aenigmatica TaxID=2015348 RepID=UPI0026CA44BB
MWFRLAKELGMSVRRAQAEVSSAEFGEWVAYFSIEPFGDRIADLRAGTIASVIANVNRTPNTPPLLPSQFMPWISTPKAAEPARSAEDIAASVFGVNLAELKKNGTRKIVLRRQPGRAG